MLMSTAERERRFSRVLQMRNWGYSFQEIGQRLGLSHHSARVIYKKSLLWAEERTRREVYYGDLKAMLRRPRVLATIQQMIEIGSLHDNS